MFMGTPVFFLFTLVNNSIGKIKVDFSVTEVMDKCDSLKICDTTTGYNSCDTTTNNLAETKFYMQAPGSDTEVEIDKNFAPDYSGCCEHGCFTITCNDYTDALATSSAVVSPQEDCGCGGNTITPDMASSCFQDGCWTMRYQVYAYGTTNVYTMSGFVGGTYSITIDGVEYPLGYVGNITTLVIALNQLKMGKFVYNATNNTITVTFFYTYGNIEGGSSSFVPVITDDVKILAGEKRKKVFMSCNILSRIKAVGLRGFSENCDCGNVPLQTQINTIFNEYQIMILSAKDSGCNCECASQYLCLLDRRLSKIENDCNG